MNLDEVRIEMERDIRAHPSDDGIALSAHTPLYPPGKIIHIVRSHPSGKRYVSNPSVVNTGFQYRLS